MKNTTSDEPKIPEMYDYGATMSFKHSSKELTDVELRMWIVSKTLEFHKSETDTARLEKDMKMFYAFIKNDGKAIPENISYV